MRPNARSNSWRKSSASPRRSWPYQRAADFNSSSASGWLTTRMKLSTDFPEGFLHRTAFDFTLLNFPGPTVNDIIPFGLSIRVRVRSAIQAGYEFVGQVSPVFLRQGQH